MMDYGFNFMNTKIHFDNESTICVVKNPVYHSRTKQIEIRHHFIRDCYEKRLIDVLKIHTDSNVADLLTKGFDVTRINFLVISMDLRLERSSPGKYNSSMVYATGIHNLSNAEIYAGLATLGYLTEGDFVPLLPAMLAGAAMDQGDGLAQPAEPHHTPVDPLPSTSLPPIPSPTHSPLQSPTHSPLQSPPHSPLQSPPHSPLQSPPHSPLQSPPYSPPRSYEAPLPKGNTSGSAEASIQLKELMVLVPNLVTRVTSLEKKLKETKHTLGNAVLKLVKKVKSLEIALKRKSKKVIMSASEDEEPEGQREGKAQMVEEDIQATHKTKEQIRQKEARLEEAIRLQAQMDEEVAKQIHLDKMVAKRVQEEQELSEQQLKRKAEVQEAAQFYTKEDWDTIRAKLKANTEVVKSLQGESISNDDFAKRMVEMINEKKKKFYAE
ncbi:hypothetical protein Tco_0144127 [Tanacetum coccineum]